MWSMLKRSPHTPKSHSKACLTSMPDSSSSIEDASGSPIFLHKTLSRLSLTSSMGFKNLRSVQGKEAKLIFLKR
ncbi:hypothetical protein Mapa_003593 [Marchantia paleacea]|nr:hypothetical protein Mapa_003593 [Marchantia paleacea]